jgi:putative addiction module component (TIGR02574 family)
MASTNDIIDEAMKLPENERTKVALELLDSIEPPDPLGHLDDEAWLTEMNRRADRAAKSEFKGSSWEEVRARLEQKLGT